MRHGDIWTVSGGGDYTGKLRPTVIVHIENGGRNLGKTWEVQEAKARFSAFLEASAAEGPQIVTKRGVEAAVLLSIEQWRGYEKPHSLI